MQHITTYCGKLAACWRHQVLYVVHGERLARPAQGCGQAVERNYAAFIHCANRAANPAGFSIGTR